MDVEVGHDRLNVACTIVLLKCKVAAGQLQLPLIVELGNSSEEAWEKAAEQYLSSTLELQQKQIPYVNPVYKRIEANKIFYENMSEDFLRDDYNNEHK